MFHLDSLEKFVNVAVVLLSCSNAIWSGGTSLEGIYGSGFLLARIYPLAKQSSGHILKFTVLYDFLNLIFSLTIRV